MFLPIKYIDIQLYVKILSGGDKMKKVNARKTVIIMLIFTVIILAFYYKITNNNDKNGDSIVKPKTEIEKLINKDLENSYPGSPREVVNFYSRIIKCFYESDLKEEQLDALTIQVRKLFDDELILNNPNEEYLEDLKEEIIEYKDAKRVIVNYIIQKSSMVEYSKSENRDYASIIASYTLKEKDERSKTYEQFILRQDENGNWKILGWAMTDSIDIQE